MRNAGLERSDELTARIYSVRGQSVMLDADLAKIYGVTTKRLNEQLKRNKDRFPEDFAFRLTAKELAGPKREIGFHVKNARNGKEISIVRK